jgi:hypothetical protein
MTFHIDDISQKSKREILEVWNEAVKYMDAQDKKIAEVAKERDDYKATLLYCKHNSKGQGFRINGIFKKWSDD